MPVNKAIVSFANQRGNYTKGLLRLSESLRDNFDGDFIGFINESSIGAPLHTENPYAFKIYAIQKAIDAGYEQILWCDSSCYAIQNIKPVFDIIENEGYFMQEAGHIAGEWTNDRTLEYFGITRDEAMTFLMFTAGFTGININSKICRTFFDRWQKSMLAGMFKGEWDNSAKSESEDGRCKGHRHDMSCGSIIASQLKMKYQKGDEWLQYGGIYDKVANDKVFFKIQGV